MMMENNSFLPVASLTKLEGGIFGLDISHIQKYLNELDSEEKKQEVVNFYGEVMSGLMTGEYVGAKKDERDMWVNFLNKLKSMSEKNMENIQ